MGSLKSPPHITNANFLATFTSWSEAYPALCIPLIPAYSAPSPAFPNTLISFLCCAWVYPALNNCSAWSLALVIRLD